MEDLDSERILDLQTDSRLHIISGGTKVVQHSPPLKASAGLKRKFFFFLVMKHLLPKDQRPENKLLISFTFLFSCGQWLCGLCVENRILYLSGKEYAFYFGFLSLFELASKD